MSREFDKSKDVCLWEESAYADEYTTLTVGIYQYDGGKRKVQISREKKGEFSKLGRMTYEEFSAVARTVKRAFDEVEKADRGEEVMPF